MITFTIKLNTMQKKPSSYQRTLVLLKPDTVQRGLMGEIISRFEKKRLKNRSDEIYQSYRRTSKSALLLVR